MQKQVRSLIVLFSLCAMILSVGSIPRLVSAKDKPANYDAVIWETTAREAERFLNAIDDLDAEVESGKWNNSWDSVVNRANSLKVVDGRQVGAEEMAAFARQKAGESQSNGRGIVVIIVIGDDDPPSDPPPNPTKEPTKEPTQEPTEEPTRDPGPCPNCHYPTEVIGVWL